MENEKPAILGMAKSLGKMAIDQVVHTVKTGKGLARLETQEARIKTCKACQWFIQGNHPRCGKCKCLLSPKVKLSAAKCPIGKWWPEVY